MINQSSTPANPSPVDFRYSGSYIVADLEYVWANGKMSQNIRLVRKELGKTPDEVQNAPPVQKKPEVKENNFNPTGAPVPNEVYNVGQTYLVQDKNGKLYNITVTKLLEDGIQVTGTLTESPVGMSPSNTSNRAPIPENPTEPTPPTPTTGSKNGYTYIYEQTGNIQRVITRDKDGKFVANTGNYSFPGNKTKEMLIADARKAAGDD